MGLNPADRDAPFLWIVVAGLVWFAQEEIQVEPDAIVVRRWLWRLLGRPGRRILRDSSLRLRVFEGGMGYNRFKTVTPADSVTVDLALWSTKARESLLTSLKGYGPPVEIVQRSILDD